MLNKEQNKLYNLPHRKIEDWDKEYQSIYFFQVPKLHNSGYRFIVVVDDKQKEIIGFGDVLNLKMPIDTRIDCDRNGIFHLWHWSYNLKVTGISDITVEFTNKRNKEQK